MNAIISPCGAYRYLLKRQAESMAPMKSTALFIMFNPSTADATLDDPTVRRCRGFARNSHGRVHADARQLAILLQQHDARRDELLTH